MVLPSLAVCTTNYNCGHALESHLTSVYEVFADVPFEYAVVDSRSRDSSMSILRKWARDHGNLRFFEKRCTRGEGRNIAVRMTRAPVIVVVDTDVVCFPRARIFVQRCVEEFPEFGFQAIFLGVFPRALWNLVRGQRSLNIYEDVDFWLRLHALGRMRWYPRAMGDNLKESEAEGRFDHFSSRYSKMEQLTRLVRREWDLWSTRQYEGVDLESIIRQNTLDFGLGESAGGWVTNRPRSGRLSNLLGFSRFLRQVLRS